MGPSCPAAVVVKPTAVGAAREAINRALPHEAERQKPRVGRASNKVHPLREAHALGVARARVRRDQSFGTSFGAGLVPEAVDGLAC